ncbi:TetR/AcrR family transcriptional regulator [Methylocella silvestris]|uniref:HTH tetR-type domain-containing protein n=1 Tax=Methylocella silvestris TaxID=199596 RepID=A0A2J7TM24_METSI|nr:TetR/AcrR family transcriptional regulator [Methylocella silvestris]PNG27810.1 hypothetical protein CR492_02605 [Methylocella silvestris]
MMTSPARKYRASEKRESTRQQNSADIQAAAWRVFCNVGMDAANVRDIVKLSGLSPGTFYNYFRTKEAIFEVIAQDLFERLRIETRAVRARATNPEELLFLAYSSYLDFVQSIDGAMDFIQRNQHYIRSEVYPSTAIHSLSTDLERDLRRFIPPSAMSDEETGLFAAMIIAAGAEAVFRATQPPEIRIEALRAFLTRFMLGGLNAWRPAEPQPASPDRRPSVANDA